jgi:crotonobetainyl-CoA:carnitine CoA-transferase CaiB-like acyl-CoA transferase
MLSGGLACYDTYLLSDGQVAIAALEERFWNVVCDIVGGLEAYRADHARTEYQEHIRRRLTAYFANLSRADVDRIFGSRDACVSVIQSYEDMLASEQAVARNFVVTEPGLPVPVLAFPAMINGARLRERGPAPKQGQDNEAVFSTLDVLEW